MKRTSWAERLQGFFFFSLNSRAQFMADLIWLFANIPNDISPAAYTDCLRLIPLTPQIGFKDHIDAEHY